MMYILFRLRLYAQTTYSDYCEQSIDGVLTCCLVTDANNPGDEIHS
jgi:hypothetical protein